MRRKCFVLICADIVHGVYLDINKARELQKVLDKELEDVYKFNQTHIHETNLIE